MWVYIQSEPGLWTVGFYAPDGKWHSDSDHDRREAAAERVAYLNGEAGMKTVVIKREPIGIITASDDHWIEPSQFISGDEELGEYTDMPAINGGSWIVNRLSLAEVEVQGA